MVFYGSRWVFMVFMVPDWFSWFFMVPGWLSWSFMVPGGFFWFLMVPGWFSWFFMIPGWFMMVPGWFFMVPGGFSWLFISIPTKKYCTAKYYIIIGRSRWDRQYYLGIVWELCLGLTGCGASFCFTRHRIVLREHLIFF